MAEALEATLQANQLELSQIQIDTARQQWDQQNIRNRISTLENQTRALARVQVIRKAQIKSKTSVMKEEALTFQKQRHENQKSLAELNQKFSALQIRGYTTRPEQWDEMNSEERINHQELLRKEAHEKMGIDSVKCFNIAVTGGTGTGKSSLINALRGLKDNHPDAAKTGEIETTALPKSHQFPKSRHLVIWDLPGSGTDAHPASSYFMDKHLYAFDCVIIVTVDRFTENECRLAQTCEEFQTPIVFVRNKSDQALNSMMDKKNLAIEVAAVELKAKVEASVRKTLVKYGLGDKRLYVISAWAFLNSNKFKIDENQFVEYVLACAYKRNSITAN